MGAFVAEGVIFSKIFRSISHLSPKNRKILTENPRLFSPKRWIIPYSLFETGRYGTPEGEQNTRSIKVLR
jgi:hypothetical protein